MVSVSYEHRELFQERAHTHTRVPHSKRLAIGALNVGEGPRAPAGGPEKNRAAMCKKAGKYDMFAVF